jgi:hypothetical protein
VGDLFIGNKGPDRDFPGFLICPTCGRALDPDDPGSHSYPADVPPHWGKQRGPRAGSPCPNRSDFTNQVILGHKFYSEVILLGVDLPDTMDAPFWEPSGRAVWYSFGTLLANAAALVLQVDPGELKVGVRAVWRGPGRLHGEVFLYDDVPGGAGYARAIQQNLEAILKKALDLGQHCPNPDCSGCTALFHPYPTPKLTVMPPTWSNSLALAGQSNRRSLEENITFLVFFRIVPGSKLGYGLFIPYKLVLRLPKRVLFWLNLACVAPSIPPLIWNGDPSGCSITWCVNKHVQSKV